MSRSSALVIRPLGSDDERHAFKEGYERNLIERSKGALSLSLPLDYVATSRTRGVFTPGERLVGGYIVRVDPPFRCLRAVPEEVRSSDEVLRDTPEASFCELTCIWREPSLSTARFGSTVWPRIIADCVRAKRRYILGLGFDNRMSDTYQVWSPRSVYRGPSAASETATEVHVFAFTRPRIVANFVTNFALQMPRKVFRRARRPSA